MSGPGDTSAAFCATLVDEWVRRGVRHAVVAPGSRSTPMAVALAANPAVSLHVFHDERVAGFVALGIGRASGVPAVLLCTSGTAAAHFVAPVHEAHLSRVPMIVCTADRPPELRDVSAPQTIDQIKLFGSAARWSHDPGVPAEDARHSWRSLARRALAAATGTLPGAVHLNLPFREPLLGVAGELPPVQDAHVPSAVLGIDPTSVAAVAGEISGRRGVIVAGRGSTPALLDLARALGWPVLADSTSGLRTGDRSVVMAFDPILRSPVFASAHRPEVVLRVGDLPASKVMSQWVASSGAMVVQVKGHEAVVDPDHGVARVITGPVSDVIPAMVPEVRPCGSEWMDGWSAAESAAQAAIDASVASGDTEIAVARAVSAAVHGNLVVSSSMPIRDIEWYGAPTGSARVHSNRGANGIDGVISTAIGVAIVTGEQTVVHIGDVAFLHDSNALIGLKARDVSLTVVVTNNDGGSIFSFLPQASQVDAATFEVLYGTPHSADIKSLAAAHGIEHVSAGDAAVVAREVSRGGTRIVEFVSPRGSNVAAHDAVNAAVVAAVESATA